jgi:hypothetical protein
MSWNVLQILLSTFAKLPVAVLWHAVVEIVFLGATSVSGKIESTLSQAGMLGPSTAHTDVKRHSFANIIAKYPVPKIISAQQYVKDSVANNVPMRGANSVVQTLVLLAKKAVPGGS